MRTSLRTSASQDEAESAPKKTPLILFWAFATLIWSIFTPPDKTFAARILLFQPTWALRMLLDDSTWVQDLTLCLALHSAFGYTVGSWRVPRASDFSWIDFNDDVFMLYIKLFALLGACGALAGGIVHRGVRIDSSNAKGQIYEQTIDEQLLPPLLIAGRTTHSRMVPKKHSFSYSYLLVGIPIGSQGRVSDALSVDTKQRSWFHVSAADYLARGGAQIGLGEKLKRYLHSQGVTDREYAYAYLVTAPRFLGYNFNPVSFWYLYDSDTALKFIILEVNNTFDERRMYLLRADRGEQSDSDAASHGVNGDGKLPSKSFVFSDTFAKDFHVSPFNSTKGTYSLRAIDPHAAYQESGQVKIDNTIVLRTSDDVPKIIARVWSQNSPIEADKVTNLQLFGFISRWWWVGFATFPRIVFEAAKLSFQKKLHVWYRPEVADTSIGRPYTSDEVELESYFRAFLEDVVSASEQPFRLIYEPAHADGDEIVMYSPSFTYEEDQQRTFTLQVLTPAFYSRYVHYAHAKEAFDRECLATDEKNRTLAITNPSLLSLLLDAIGESRKRARTVPTAPRMAERLRWSWLHRLRCPPPQASYPHYAEHTVTDIRSFKSSELDEYVMQHAEDVTAYQRIAWKLFFAQRFAFGTPALLSAVDWTIRAGLLLATMWHACQTDVFDVLRPREYQIGDFGEIVWMLLLANSVHMWSFLKG